MKPFVPSSRSIIEINVNLLLATACGFVAWLIWPTDAELWGLGVISIILWLGAAGGFVKSVRTMSVLHARTKVLNDYRAQGPAPKSSRLASRDDLKRAGMLDE